MLSKDLNAEILQRLKDFFLATHKTGWGKHEVHRKILEIELEVCKAALVNLVSQPTPMELQALAMAPPSITADVAFVTAEEEAVDSPLKEGISNES